MVLMRMFEDPSLDQPILLRIVIEKEVDYITVVTVYKTSNVKRSPQEGKMKVTYDTEANAMVITFRDDKIKESDEVSPGIIADFGFDGALLRLEILDASKVVQNASEMQFAVTKAS